MDKVFKLNNPVTYIDLINVLTVGNTFDNITVKINDEYYAISKICMAKKDSNDVLDEGHIYLEVKI